MFTFTITVVLIIAGLVWLGWYLSQPGKQTEDFVKHFTDLVSGLETHAENTRVKANSLFSQAETLKATADLHVADADKATSIAAKVKALVQ